MNSIDIYKLEDLLADTIAKAGIAQDQDTNPEDNDIISAIVTGGYPKKGIIEFSAKDNTRKFKITIEEQ